MILSTDGTEFLLGTTREVYVGLYYYSRGLPYAGTGRSPRALRLYDIKFGTEAIDFRRLKPSFGQHLDDPTSYRPRPTLMQYILTRIPRYFVKNLYTKTITEVEKSTYKDYKKKSLTLHKLYETVKFDWKISGTLHDIIDSSGTITSTGIIETNQRTMAIHKPLFPELPLVLPADDLAKITS